MRQKLPTLDLKKSKKMALQPASGARDLNPQQVESNQKLSKTLSDIYRIWGYEEVSPPSVERLDTLKAGGAIGSSEILRLVANEPLGLRPEMTASIARAACTRLSKRPRPLRLWSAGTVFKCRESVEGGISIEENLHSGVEIFGVKGMEAEMELLSLLLKSVDILELNNIKKPVLLIGHTSLMDLILCQLETAQKAIIRKSLIEYNRLGLELQGTEANTLDYLLKIQGIRGLPTKVISSLSKIFSEESVLDSLRRIFEFIEPLAERYGIKIQLDPTFQPHYELYNGLVFQLICYSESTPIVIARGGRYDELVKKCGAKGDLAAGLGFSFSLENIQELNKYSDNDSSNETSTLISYGPNSSLEKAIEKQGEIHQEGGIAILELEKCKTKQDARNLNNIRKCKKVIWLN